MSITTTVRAETIKTVTLPAFWIAAAIGIIGSVLLAWVNASTVHSAHLHHQSGLVSDSTAFDGAYAPAALIVSVAAVIVGVTAMSAEYTPTAADAGAGRQITTTLTATPSRTWVFLGKIGVVAVATTVIGWVATGSATLIYTGVVGPYAQGAVPLTDIVLRLVTGAAYWVLLAWIALAVATIARTGLVPLIVLIINCAVVPISLLLTHVTPLAQYLPDRAGQGLFGFPESVAEPPDMAPLPGGLVMAAWSVTLLTAAAVAFSRRDA